MIKVCHFTSVHKAGDTRIFVKECRSLARAGYHTTLVAANAQMELRDGVAIVGVQTPTGRLFRMLFGARRVYKKALELNADVYHFHDPELLRFAKRLKRRGKIVIYDSHEDLPRQVAGKYYIPRWLRPLAVKCVEAWENRVVRNLDAVVAATPIIRDKFRAHGVTSIEVCNYPSLDELPAPFPFDQKEQAACYVGSITEVRGIREKVAAMNGADFKLILGGTFAPAELETEMKNQPGWKNVEFLGFLTRDRVIDVLRRSKVGLVTMRPVQNLAEGLPVKMYEYMAAGIPVISNNIPLWKSIVEENHCGICVDVFNQSELQNAIRHLIHDNELAQRLGANGRQAIETKYNWKNEERKLLELYTSLIGRK